MYGVVGGSSCAVASPASSCAGAVPWCCFEKPPGRGVHTWAHVPWHRHHKPVCFRCCSRCTCFLSGAVQLSVVVSYLKSDYCNISAKVKFLLALLLWLWMMSFKVWNRATFLKDMVPLSISIEVKLDLGMILGSVSVSLAWHCWAEQRARAQVCIFIHTWTW